MEQSLIDGTVWQSAKAFDNPTGRRPELRVLIPAGFD
jgi:hypothetical protein